MDKLLIVWSSGDEEVAKKMVLLYSSVISTYPNLISKKIILQLEHEKDRRTKRRR